MPLYDYRCRNCGREVTDVFTSRHSDPPPELDEPCEVAPEGSAVACELERLVGSVSHRFRASEGVGGWERQGELLIRRIRGTNSERYGEGSV